MKVTWLLKSIRAREQKKLCAMLVSISWQSTDHQSTVYHSATVRNNLWYIIIFISYDGRPCILLKRVNSWCCYAGKLLFLGTVTSLLQRNRFNYQYQVYRIQKHIIYVSSRDLCYWNTCANFHVIWSLATLGLQNQNKVVRWPKGKHKSKLVLSKVDNSCLLA